MNPRVCWKCNVPILESMGLVNAGDFLLACKDPNKRFCIRESCFLCAIKEDSTFSENCETDAYQGNLHEY